MTCHDVMSGVMGRQRWKLTGLGRMDTWGDAPKADPEAASWAGLLAWMAAEPDSGMYEIAPGWYSSRPARMSEDGSIRDA